MYDVRYAQKHRTDKIYANKIRHIAFDLLEILSEKLEKITDENYQELIMNILVDFLLKLTQYKKPDKGKKITKNLWIYLSQVNQQKLIEKILDICSNAVFICSGWFIYLIFKYYKPWQQCNADKQQQIVLLLNLMVKYKFNDFILTILMYNMSELSSQKWLCILNNFTNEQLYNLQNNFQNISTRLPIGVLFNLYFVKNKKIEKYILNKIIELSHEETITIYWYNKYIYWIEDDELNNIAGDLSLYEAIYKQLKDEYFIAGKIVEEKNTSSQSESKVSMFKLK